LRTGLKHASETKLTTAGYASPHPSSVPHKQQIRPSRPCSSHRSNSTRAGWRDPPDPACMRNRGLCHAEPWRMNGPLHAGAVPHSRGAKLHEDWAGAGGRWSVPLRHYPGSYQITAATAADPPAEAGRSRWGRHCLRSSSTRSAGVAPASSPSQRIRSTVRSEEAALAGRARIPPSLWLSRTRARHTVAYPTSSECAEHTRASA